MATKENKKNQDDILAKAKERYKLAEEIWRPVYAEALDDLKFLSGDQWDDSDKQARKLDGRPCLTVNILPQYTRQIVNDQRQNKTQIKVNPVDDKADVATAEVIQGLIRHIEQASKADRAYGRAFENAVENGFGFFRIRTDYADSRSFDLEAIIDHIPNPFLVKFDPFFKELDGSDANWAFIESDYSKEDYCEEFGDSALGEDEDWKSLSEQHMGWVTEKSARVCEYYCKEFKKITLAKLSTGEVVEKDQFVEGVIGQDGAPISIVSEKTASIPVVHHYKLNAVEILEETVFPGEFIPVIPVFGKEIVLGDKRIFESLIRHAKDTQKMRNYWVTCETETIALAPKAPWLVAEGQIPPEYKEIWATANSKNHSYLPWKPTSIAGTPVGPPTRNVYEAPVQAITNARVQASEDLKATTGMYDAALGARSNENSGIAIQRRSAQTQTSNFHFVDNLSRSIRHCGRILVDVIPQVYDTARTARIIGDEGQEDLIKINQIFEHKGEQKFYRFDLGKYDVSIDTGPSYATKRQEAVASMLDLSKVSPKIVDVAGDLMVKSMDWPGAQEISERLKKTLPPGLADSPEQKPLPPEVQAQMAQMGQTIQAMTQQLDMAKQALATKAMELESKERIEFAKLENNLVIEQIKVQGQAALASFKEELSEISNRLELLRIHDPMEPTQDFNGAGLNQAVQPQEPQPTGGQSPGPYMGA